MIRVSLLCLLAGCSPAPEPCVEEGNGVGDCAPDFSLGRANGGSWTLSEHVGSVILVQFAAAWCGVCQLTAGTDQSLVEYQSDGFTKVTILKGDAQYQEVDEAEALEWKDAFELDHPVLYDPEKAVWKEWKHKTSTVPQQFIVDRGGAIRWRRIGLTSDDELRVQIEEVLGQPE
ncbi:MAG: TlpA family protein disulfide reductase [Myxococcota bacterium]